MIQLIGLKSSNKQIIRVCLKSSKMSFRNFPLCVRVCKKQTNNSTLCKNEAFLFKNYEPSTCFTLDATNNKKNGPKLKVHPPIARLSLGQLSPRKDPALPFHFEKPAPTDRVCEKESTAKSPTRNTQKKKSQPTQSTNKEQPIIARNVILKVQPERKKRSERAGVWNWFQRGNLFSIRILRGQQFPVAHAGSERDPSPKAKESVGVGVAWLWKGGGHWRVLAGKIAVRSWKAAFGAWFFSIDISV